MQFKVLETVLLTSYLKVLKVPYPEPLLNTLIWNINLKKETNLIISKHNMTKENAISIITAGSTVTMYCSSICYLQKLETLVSVLSLCSTMYKFVYACYGC